jgi:hypothetical protein
MDKFDSLVKNHGAKVNTDGVCIGTRNIYYDINWKRHQRVVKWWVTPIGNDEYIINALIDSQKHYSPCQKTLSVVTIPGQFLNLITDLCERVLMDSTSRRRQD